MREDLLRRAVESKKTTSRKARSKQATPASSRTGSPAAGSRAGSRIGSRDPSDDEDMLNEFSDGTNSPTSIDGILSGGEDDDELDEARWETDFKDRISRIGDRNRKGGSAAGRGEDLRIFVRMSQSYYIKDAISLQIPELYTAFLKYLRADSGEIEQLFAIEAIALTTITDPASSEGLAYEMCSKPLQDLVTDSDSMRVKEVAIQALALVVFLSADDDTAEHTIMPFMHSIFESDGVVIAAEDEPEVVAAALLSWSLLATLLDDAENATSEAIEALVDQLDSAEGGVQVAAGEAIALLYEKSYTEQESDEEFSGDEDVLDRGKTIAPLVNRYQPYRRKDQLLEQLHSLSSVSTRTRNKKDRKELHSSFTGIYKGVEDPRRGPGYSDAINKDTGEEYGSRMRVKIGENKRRRIAGTTFNVDQWWKLIRLRVMRRWLKGGFAEHYRENAMLRAVLTG